MRISQRAAAAAATLALLTAGTSTACSPFGDDSGDKGGNGTAANSVAKGHPSVSNPGKLIIQTTADSTMGKVDLGIAGLTVRGKLANLVVSLTPHVDAGGDTPTLFRLNGSNDASLLDTVNLKRYVVVHDSDNNTLGPDLHGDLKNNAANTLNFVFAAPPDNVKAVDVQIGKFPIFRDVPIGR
ncbi:hypothetical protein J4573_46545 [Actinomadura barringtoniae]|uniref:DUF4352 domain-containing protein n=1 Tax=Actinomadura barringtoniae TaxID=1427535 RepID=A0A939PKI7_9ACTN|nr:hypothetical protein [Actinomadura barringtoniae]MBO2454617.1 hypothetical protein [Actinomadura barringtoniae]